MRRYETIFILRPNAGEEDITRVIESTSKIILDEKGTIIELARWGMKKLAYLIKKESLGYYVYCDYAGTPAAVSEIERKFRIDDLVLKYLTIKTAGDITDAGIEEAKIAISTKATAQQDSADDSDADDSEDTDNNNDEDAD